MMKFKETEADIQVKNRLWDATEREMERFATSYAAGHLKGERYSDAQKNVTSAAKSKGYPKGLIRELGDLVRRDSWGGGRGPGYPQGLSCRSWAVI